MSETKVWRNIAWGVVIVLVALVVAVPFRPGRTEPVTRERLAEARKLWEQARITDYDLELETSGAQTGHYLVSVRAGKLINITRNGQPADPKAGEYWTVPGLFLIIEEELDAAEQPESGAFGAESQVWLRMRCDAKLGYPLRFVREVKQPSRRTATGYEAPGAALGVEIRVKRLTPL